jgi:hypothetical protein
MYERLLDKNIVLDEDAIEEHMGKQGYERLKKFEGILGSKYQLSKELKFPFGKEYGWGYKYAHRSAHLCYVFFEKGSFTVTLQIGDKQVQSVESTLPSLSQKTQTLWKDRYPCGECGGWIHYRILAEDEMADVVRLIEIRKKPVK